MHKELYKGFMMVEEVPDGSSKSYRSMDYYLADITTHTSWSLAAIRDIIDETAVYGDFSQEQFDQVMGADEPVRKEPQASQWQLDDIRRFGQHCQCLPELAKEMLLMAIQGEEFKLNERIKKDVSQSPYGPSISEEYKELYEKGLWIPPETSDQKALELYRELKRQLWSMRACPPVG